MRLKIGDPAIIVRGGKCEDVPWGPYQFPKLFQGEDGVYACVHVEDDSPDCYGMPEKWFISRDGGAHWTETDDSARFRCGTKLKNGEYQTLDLITWQTDRISPEGKVEGRFV